MTAAIGPAPPPAAHKVVVAGGGVAGLTLVARLSKWLRKTPRAELTLIDASPTHIWKPLLHEVASGSLNAHEDELGYLMHAHRFRYRFCLGRVDDIARQQRQVLVAPMLDESGAEYIPRRTFAYDTLILALGSEANDYGIEGVCQHCHFLDHRKDAERFHQLLLRAAGKLHARPSSRGAEPLSIAIAGGGATGIELSAELHQFAQHIAQHGLDGIRPERDLRITLIEGAERLLPALPQRFSGRVAQQLADLNIRVVTGRRVERADEKGFYLEDGSYVPAAIKVWVAGIKAPDFLARIEGLEHNAVNQLSVRSTLQTTRDDDIFALGDCAACPLAPDDARRVPPRAQAAHQQAGLVYRSVKNRLVGKPLPSYRYTDYGSLINMSHYSTVGKLMGNLARLFSGSVFVEGVLARIVYRSLYRMHQLSVRGWVWVVLYGLADFLTRRTKPRMKLH